jgi:hypothetical protein
MNKGKKKFPNESDPREFPRKRWLGGYDDYAPNGYSLQDEFGWTSRDQREMYNGAIRDLQVQINIAQEQKKKK